MGTSFSDAMAWTVHLATKRNDLIDQLANYRLEAAGLAEVRDVLRLEVEKQLLVSYTQRIKLEEARGL